MDKEKLNFYNMFWIFFLASVFGWVIELCFTLITQGIFINHSALVIGPFNIAYGICACLLTSLLYRFKDCNYIKLFLIGFIGGSIIEYIMSWGMELFLGFSAWDYTGKFLNINGRVCFKMSLLWGILGIAWIKIIYPRVDNFIVKINNKLGKKLVIVLIVFLILDAGLTVYSIARAKEFEKDIPPSNVFERFLDTTFNKAYLTNMFNNKWETTERNDIKI